MTGGLFFSEVPSVAAARRDVSLGARPGDDGLNGVGIERVDQVPNTFQVIITLTDGRQFFADLPPGPPGVDATPPEFIEGELGLIPFGGVATFDVRRVSAGVFAIDLLLPDPSESAVAAQASAVASAASASGADASEFAASGFASTAASSVVQAATQVALAADQVDLAADQVGLATGQVALAAGQVTLATAQAGNAATSAGQASGFASAAAATYDAFDDRYLGAKVSDPSADNDGNPLVVGALYFNTTTEKMMARGASSWILTFAQITGGVQSFKGRDGAVVPEAGDYAVAQIAGLPAALATVTAASLWLAGG